ncbi:major histocompatibility complex class I-related gene protein-like [Pituophis catenifer annectens]|uniref:major histocompatibility complex class I-related gene protein-like n=1 Tax=Pituophis catenifer annectens TaxID=94852 RepID=UPI003994C20F
MAPRLAPLSLLVLAVITLREGCFGGSHSLKYFQNYISDPSQGRSYYVTVGYVDGQLFSSSDSNSRKEQPRVSWMEKLEKEYWDSQSHIGRLNEERFRRNLEILRNRYSQSEGSSLHSLKYFYISVSDLSQGLPHFGVLGYMDSQVFVVYDSNSRKFQPRASWMEKVEKDYWDTQSQIGQVTEEVYRAALETLRNRHNQSKGLHMIQQMYGCERRGDGSKGGFYHFGYDGRTFITFDKETVTWVAPNPQAQITQRKWDALPGFSQRVKSYLEEECIGWLEKYLSYGKEILLRTETPVVTVSSRTEAEDGMETHVCRVDGFYPREIDATWRRDGEVWLQDTLQGSVAPNADGTFHYWLSIQIDPKERGHYRCHVEHDGLKEPLDVALKESNLRLIIGCIVASLVLVCTIVIAGIWFFKRYQKATEQHQVSDFSSLHMSANSESASDVL